MGAAAAAEKQNGQNGQNNNSTHYSWLSIGFYCFGIMYVIQWIYKTISFELDQKKKMEEQQKLMQQQQQQGMVGQMAMNPYQNMGMNPYGGYVQPTGYGMGMNPYGQPMMQQPMQQLPQTPQINNPTDSSTDAKKGNDTDKSDSLLAK